MAKHQIVKYFLGLELYSELFLAVYLQIYKLVIQLVLEGELMQQRTET